MPNEDGEQSASHAADQAQVCGVGLDGQSRCIHYHGPLDIVAIRMRCCGTYYACRTCHDEIAPDHAVQLWATWEHDSTAILCGACRTELTVGAYLAGGDACPTCGAGFNPRCRKHHHLYFAS